MLSIFKKIVNKKRKILLLLMDAVIIIIANVLSTIILNNNLNLQIVKETLQFALISLGVYEILLLWFDVYNNVTKYENGNSYLMYGFISFVSFIILLIIKIVFVRDIFGIRELILATIFIVMSLITYRVILRMMLLYLDKGNVKGIEKKRLLIVGANVATRDIIKSIKEGFVQEYKVVGIVDKSEEKYHFNISGIKIIGSLKDIKTICKEKAVDAIFFTDIEMNPEEKSKTLRICQETGAKVRILTDTANMIKGKEIKDNLRNLNIEDVLYRDVIKLDNENIGDLIKDNVVMVTGGGGSIGSELCRQIMKYSPKKLVIFDIYENNLYDIQMELQQIYDKNKIAGIIGSVRDKERLKEVFEEFKPYLVFHAAAHKHVPLMEVSPLEAIKNNIFGTYNVVNFADKYCVKRFILISTDKAVNPTNIMGATKRMCEMIVQAKNKVSNTEYAAVRFGNVLGSNGSVIPLFKKQIEKGGPVTVTHKEITRFFMTIPEAVQLVLQAMSYAKGGEIFVLDMGEPVKIYNLAETLIRLSGLEPNIDIAIEITGLRPGEKLYEELLMSEEGLKETEHKKIFIAKPMDIGINEINEKISKLEIVVNSSNNNLGAIKKAMKDIVPTYREV